MRIYENGSESIVTSSLASLWAFELAFPEVRLSLALVCPLMQTLHLSEPAKSGASHMRQHTENPICSMALLGSDMQVAIHMRLRGSLGFECG